MSPRLVVAGAAGRMGRAILAAAQADGATLVGALDRAAGRVGETTVTTDPAPLLAAADVVVDFSAPAPAAALAGEAAAAGVALVIGVTGFSDDEDAAIAAAAQQVAVVKSGNMSLGIALLSALARRAAAALGPDYDIEIVETHHRAKVDAPSGTALMLGAAAAAGRGETLDRLAAHDRRGARPRGAIGFAVSRGGGVPGDHEVRFAGDAEIVTLAHRALDRSLFARGALAAARWVAGRPAGLYDMTDVLGLGRDV